MALRILHDHLGRTLSVVATSEATGFPATHLETGDRHRFWQGSSAVEQTLTYDAGSGATKTVDYVVLPRADLLVAAGASVDIQWSADASTNWTSVGAPFPLAPIALGDLLAPTVTDYVAEWTGLAKRGWRVRLYGTLSAAPSLAGGLLLGARTEVADPIYGRALSVSRTHRGLELELSWPPLSDAATATLLAALAAVTPDAAEGPHETVAGAIYGGLAHYLYDTTGTIVRTTGTAALIPVLCLTPESAASVAVAAQLERGPASVRWRERR